MKLKLNGITALLLLCNTLTKAQAPLKQISPTSPEASALSKAISYPVDFTTGLPDISVPLYTIESGDLKLPIALSYHSGGFKINEQSTSVGLGWSLTSDIQITRSVNGLDDFQPTIGYLANTLVKNSCSGCDYPFNGGSYFGANAIALGMGKVDGMPDKFNYKLLNKSGSFYFVKNDNGIGYYTILPVPYDNIKISYDNGKFTITDTDGTVYTFGSTLPVNTANPASQGFEVTGEGYTDFSGIHYDYSQTNPYRITAWKCRSITNATQTASINFTYQAKAVTVGTKPVEKIDYYNNANPCQVGSGINLNNAVSAAMTTYTDVVSNYSLYSLSSPRYFTVWGVNTVFHLPYLPINQTNGQYLTTPVDRTFPVQYTTPGSIGEYQTGNASSLISGIAVSGITFNGGSATFNGTDQLNSIIVRNSSNDQVKSIFFNSTYTSDASSNPAYVKTMNGDSFQGTLYLDSVRIAGNGLSHETYAFLYNSKKLFGNHLVGSDAWGYWNISTHRADGTGAVISVPLKAITQRFYLSTNGGCTDFADNIIFNIGATDSERPDDGVKSGTLSSIVYPTGGFTVFDFEPNLYKVDAALSDYSGSYPLVQKAGGLRIRSICNYDDSKTQKLQSQKYYRYGDLEDGIGFVMNAPSRNFITNTQSPVTGAFTGYSYSQDMIYYTNSSSLTAYTKSSLFAKFRETKTTYLATSAMDYSYPNGSPIYYTKVTEYNSDLGLQTGKKVYNYFPAPAGNQPSLAPGTNLPILRADRELGLAQSILDYKYENGVYKLFHSKEFTYQTLTYGKEAKVAAAYMNNIYLPMAGGGPISSGIDMYNGSFGLNNAGGNADCVANQYSISSQRQLPTAENEKWITDSDILTQSTTYTYNYQPYLNPDAITTTNSKGEQIKKTFKYAYNLPGTPIYSQMATANMISEPIDVVTTNVSTGKELSHTLTNYAIAGAINGSLGFIAPVSIQISTQGGALETQETFLFNEKGNVIQTTDKNGLLKSYLWGYNYQYPIVEFVGVNYATAIGTTDVSSFQTITDDTQMRNALAVLRNNPAALVSSFTYKPMVGVTSMTAPNGLDKFYDYDDFGRMTTIKDHNQNIVTRYAYKYRTNSYGYYPIMANVPAMATFVQVCMTTPASFKSLNYIVPGGRYQGTYVEGLNSSAEDQVFVEGAAQPESTTAGDPASSFAIINMSSFMYNGFPTANNMWMDFFQNNSIVASNKFPSTANGTVNGPTGQCYVKGGVYTIGFRQSAIDGVAMLKYHVSCSDGTFGVLKSGDTFTLKAGETYLIQVSNCI